MVGGGEGGTICGVTNGPRGLCEVPWMVHGTVCGCCTWSGGTIRSVTEPPYK